MSCNPIDDIRIETVGIPFKCNQVKLAEDGEILVKGENVMRVIGIMKKKQKSFNKWMAAQGIGEFENYLKITDEKKILSGTPGGDNISPLKVENMLTSSEIIDQAIIYGDNKPYLVALVILKKNLKTKKKIRKK